MGADVDVAAAPAVDPLVDPHPAPAVAAAVQLDRAAAAAAHVAGRPQQDPARADVLRRTCRPAARSAGWGSAGGARCRPWQGLPRRRAGGGAPRGRRAGERASAARSRGRGRTCPSLSRVRCYGRPPAKHEEAITRERASRQLPDRAPGRGRSRDRRRPRRRAAPPAADAGDDRLGELRPPGGARSGRLGADQQVRRGLPRPPLLRRLRGGRRRRAAGDRPRQGAVRRRARQRPGRTPAPRPTTPPTWR